MCGTLMREGKLKVQSIRAAKPMVALSVAVRLAIVR
jgi:hypothetical protein